MYFMLSDKEYLIGFATLLDLSYRFNDSDILGDNYIKLSCNVTSCIAEKLRHIADNISEIEISSEINISI